MSIRDNVKEIRKKMLLEVGENERPTCDMISALGLLAIHFGRNSDEWKQYMTLFAEPGNDTQLARLLATDGTENNAGMNRARAYLLADGPCTPDTVLNFGKGASETLDQGL